MLLNKFRLFFVQQLFQHSFLQETPRALEFILDHSMLHQHLYMNCCWVKRTNLKHLNVETLQSSVYDEVCSLEWYFTPPSLVQTFKHRPTSSNPSSNPSAPASSALASWTCDIELSSQSCKLHNLVLISSPSWVCASSSECTTRTSWKRVPQRSHAMVSVLAIRFP